MGADLSVNNESVAETQETEAEVVTTDVNTDSSETIEAEGQQLAEGNEAEIQSAEENAKYAAARRRAEQEFAKRQIESDLAFERRFAGYTNPITGQPIRSQKDYFDALDAQEKLQMEQSLQSGSVTADELNSYIEKQINNNPAILQAQQIIEATKQLEIQNRLENDVKEIQKLDSSVKSIDDILNKDNAAAMIHYVNDHNVSLADAYKRLFVENTNAPIHRGVPVFQALAFGKSRPLGVPDRSAVQQRLRRQVRNIAEIADVGHLFQPDGVGHDQHDAPRRIQI